MPKNSCIMQIWAEPEKSALPICNYSQILYQFLMFTQNLKRSQKMTERKRLIQKHLLLLLSKQMKSSLQLLQKHSMLNIFKKSLSFAAISSDTRSADVCIVFFASVVPILALLL